MSGDSDMKVVTTIPKFDGDFEHWSMLMENLIRSKEWWDLIEEGYVEPARGVILTGAQRQELAEKKLKDLKVKNYLFQAIDKSILKTIIQKDTAKQMWDSLKTKYQGNERVKRAQLQRLRREFEVLEMKEAETITEYFGRVLLVATDMRNVGEDMPDNKIVEKILRTLSEKFTYIVCSIEESKDIESLSVDALQSSLLCHEQNIVKHSKGSSSNDNVLKVTSEFNDWSGTRGRGRGGTFRGRGRGRGRQGFNKALIECFKCHKLGHYQFECPEAEKQANYVEFNEEEELLLMAHVELNGSKMEDLWFLDSGCSNHMTGNKKWFSEMDENFRHSVKLGNGARMVVQGKGSIKIRVSGMIQIIQDVYYVPELSNNLLSIGQLQERSLAILIQDNVCKIYHSARGLIIETAMSTNRMFIILAQVVGTDSCFQAETTGDAHLWHCRFGHLSYSSLHMLSQKKMVRGLPHIEATKKVCENCLVGKQKRGSFPKKSSWRASRNLQLIHSDICGPITPASIGRKRYILTFIDDHSRKMWSYIIAEKSEAFGTFKDFKASVEKESGVAVCCLRTDRGGEFCSKEFDEFCRTNGIKRQLTAGYTPQQNGVAERRNQTIMNLVRSTLTEKKMPKEFWAEGVRWITYVLNRSPTTALENQTPEEAWNGFKPDVKHFKVFGCIGHVHIPEAKRTKLDNKSCKCIFLGFSEESKAYRMYNPTSKKILVSRDVVFEESKNWDWGRNDEDGANTEVLVWENNEDGEEEFLEEEVMANEHNEEAVPAAAADSGNEEDDGAVDEVDEEQVVRNRRDVRRPAYLQDYECGLISEEEAMAHFIGDTMAFQVVTAVGDPTTFDEAVAYGIWREAMRAEINSIEKNQTWELVDQPEDTNIIGVKWVFKTKYNEHGEIDKHKARLVAKGYAQKFGVDYNEVYAPVARWDTIRMIIAVAAYQNWSIYQLDVKSAFLHGELEETVFIDQPQGFMKRGNEGKVYKLRKALYGLKQAPRAWFSKIESYFIREGFEKNESEHTLFVKTEKQGQILIVSLYVDDLIFTGNCEKMINNFKESMKRNFDMTDLGKMRYFLGVEILQREEGIYICQRKFAKEVLERFEMSTCNGVNNPIVPGVKLSKKGGGAVLDTTLYKQMIGSLMYLTVTRPDLTFVVCLASRYMENPTEAHFQVLKRVLRYVKGTTELGIMYKRGGNKGFHAYTDSDYAGDLDDRKSTSGYVFMLAGGAVSWSSKKQSIVALSTTEAEYIAAVSCATQGVWMARVLDKIGESLEECITIKCDNSSTIQLSKNPIHHGRSKHIEVRFHYLRELTGEGKVKLIHCGTQDQLADIMTKPLKLETFVKLRKMLGLVEAPK